MHVIRQFETQAKENSMLSDAFDRDPYLLPFKSYIEDRFSAFASLKDSITINEGCSLADFSKGFDLFGLNFVNDNIIIREYLPAASGVFLCGDFNQWDRNSHPLFPEGFGRWAITLSALSIKAGSRYKLCVCTERGERMDRVPAWATQVQQNPESNLFDAIFPAARDTRLRSPRPVLKGILKIYEAHVGMSSEEDKV